MFQIQRQVPISRHGNKKNNICWQFFIHFGNSTKQASSVFGTLLIRPLYNNHIIYDVLGFLSLNSEKRLLGRAEEAQEGKPLALPSGLMYKQTLWLVWACLLVGSVMLVVQLYKKVESGHRRSGAEGLVDTEQESDNINAPEEREEREEENEEDERVEEKEKRKEDTQLATTISCSRKGDWVDICEYTNVCFDGTNRLVLFDGNSEPSTFIPRRATRPKEGVSSFGATWFESIPFPPPPHADLPHSTQWEGAWHNARNKLAPPYGNGHMKSVWLNGTTVFMIPDVKETNLWHWGVSLFPIMEVHETTPVSTTYYTHFTLTPPPSTSFCSTPLLLLSHNAHNTLRKILTACA